MKKLYDTLPFVAFAFLLTLTTHMSAQNIPVAVNDTATMKKHHSIRINVLQNDYDPEGHPLEVFYIDNVGHGYGSIMYQDSSIYYVNSNTAGLDSLKYTIRRTDQTDVYATAWLFVNVIQNELPAFTNEPPTVMVGEVVGFNLYDVASDQDGDDFFIERVWAPEHGVEEGYNDSIFSFIITENYSGLDSCRIKITEADPDINFTTHFVFNVERNPEFPVAVCDTSIAFQGDTVYISVLQNDFDPQNDAFRICDVELEMGNLQLEYNDSIVKVMPKIITDTGFRLAFTYQVEEIENPGHISHYAGGYLYIHENPNLPVAVNDTVSVIAGFPVDIPVLLNDSDINNDTLIVSHAIPGQNLGFASHTDSIVSFTAYSNLSGMYSFSYAIREKHNEAHYCIGEIFVDVIENPIQPIVVNDTITIQGLQTIQFNPLLNDIEPGGMPIKMDQFQLNNTFISANVISDSIITVTSKINCEASINIPYSFYRTANPAMVSNEATITIHITPDESMFYGITDTIRGPQGLSGTINLIENDYNPGSETLILQYAKGDNGLICSKVNDSIVKYAINYSVGSPLEGYYILSDIQDSTRAAGKIYLDIHDPSPLIDTLNINNIQATFSSVGMNFHDPVNDESGLFEVPKGSGKQTIAQNSLWIGGKSEYTLHVAAEIHRLSGEDFWPGPISEDYQNADLAKYHVWKISRDEIDYHIAHYKDPNYEPIESIATWPGNGNQELGQAQQLAPFFDQDRDGKYEPIEGDVPQIRGDQSLYFIFNDGYDMHSESESVPMKVEIHGNAYAFDQPDDSALFNTIFLHYDFINRSEYSYRDTYIGLLNDFDLGYRLDDFIGCDVSRGAAYIYNGVPIDGSGQAEAYGENPPVQCMVMLGGVSMPNDNEDNPTGGCDESINGLNFEDGIVDNERMGMTSFAYLNNLSVNPNWIDPQWASEYYSFLDGRWKDNSPFLYGGNGHINDQQTVGPECKFIYPGASDPLNWGTGCQFPNGGYNQNDYYWNEETEGHNPKDRRGLSITGPFTFAPGEMQSLDVAWVYARDNDTTDQFSAIDIMNQRIDTIRNRVENGGIIYLPNYSVGITEKTKEPIVIRIFPNPSNGNEINIDLRKLNKNQETIYQINDLIGRKIISGKLLSGIINPIRTNGINPGIYVIIIMHGNITATQKLIIGR